MHKRNNLLLSYLQVCSNLSFNLLTQSKTMWAGIAYHHSATVLILSETSQHLCKKKKKERKGEGGKSHP